MVLGWVVFLAAIGACPPSCQHDGIALFSSVATAFSVVSTQGPSHWCNEGDSKDRYKFPVGSTENEEGTQALPH